MAPPCLKAIWGKLREKREISHSERLALAWFLQNLGYNDDAIIELFKHAPDFKEAKTRYYLSRSRKPDGSPKYRMYNCSTMKSLSMCLGCGYNKNPIGMVYLKNYGGGGR
jgi:DNA primase large subunit